MSNFRTNIIPQRLLLLFLVGCIFLSCLLTSSEADNKVTFEKKTLPWDYPDYSPLPNNNEETEEEEDEEDLQFQPNDTDDIQEAVQQVGKQSIVGNSQPGMTIADNDQDKTSPFLPTASMTQSPAVNQSQHNDTTSLLNKTSLHPSIANANDDNEQKSENVTGEGVSKEKVNEGQEIEHFSSSTDISMRTKVVNDSMEDEEKNRTARNERGVPDRNKTSPQIIHSSTSSATNLVFSTEPPNTSATTTFPNSSTSPDAALISSPTVDYEATKLVKNATSITKDEINKVERKKISTETEPSSLTTAPITVNNGTTIGQDGTELLLSNTTTAPLTVEEDFVSQPGQNRTELLSFARPKSEPHPATSTHLSDAEAIPAALILNSSSSTPSPSSARTEPAILLPNVTNTSDEYINLANTTKNLPLTINTDSALNVTVAVVIEKSKNVNLLTSSAPNRNTIDNTNQTKQQLQKSNFENYNQKSVKSITADVILQEGIVPIVANQSKAVIFFNETEYEKQMDHLNDAAPYKLLSWRMEEKMNKTTEEKALNAKTVSMSSLTSKNMSPAGHSFPPNSTTPTAESTLKNQTQPVLSETESTPFQLNKSNNDKLKIEPHTSHQSTHLGLQKNDSPENSQVNQLLLKRNGSSHHLEFDHSVKNGSTFKNLTILSTASNSTMTTAAKNETMEPKIVVGQNETTTVPETSKHEKSTKHGKNQNRDEQKRVTTTGRKSSVGNGTKRSVKKQVVLVVQQSEKWEENEDWSEESGGKKRNLSIVEAFLITFLLAVGLFSIVLVVIMLKWSKKRHSATYTLPR